MRFNKNDQQLLAEAYGEVQQSTSSNISPEMMTKALQAVKNEGKISTAFLQRILRVDKSTALSVYQQIAAKLKISMPENPDIPVQVRDTSSQSQPQASPQGKDKYAYITAIRYAQKTNDKATMQKAINELKIWAQQNNATKDPEVVEWIY